MTCHRTIPPRSGILTAAILFAALSWSPVTHAAGFQLGEQSPAAGGTAGAGTARAEDPAAAWYDPAALAFADPGWRESAGLLGVSPTVEARALDGSWSSRTRSQLATPPSAYVSFSRNGRAAGVSVNVPFGSGVVWPSGWAGRYEIVSSQLQVIRVAPFAAWRHGSLAFALGPQVDFGEMQVDKKLDMVTTEGEVAIDMVGAGAGAHAALYWDARPDLALGLTYKSRTVLPLKGAASFDTPDAFTGKAPNQSVRTRLTTPDLLDAGVSWRATPGLRVVADAGFTLWSVYDRMTLDFSDPGTTDVTMTPRWHPTLSLRGGAEIAASRSVDLRGGLLLDPSPAPSRSLAPSSPDANRIGATAGVGWRIGRTATVDAFYEYLKLLDRRTSDPDALQASYRGQAQMIGIGVRVAR